LGGKEGGERTARCRTTSFLHFCVLTYASETDTAQIGKKTLTKKKKRKERGKKKKEKGKEENERLVEPHRCDPFFPADLLRPDRMKEEEGKEEASSLSVRQLPSSLIQTRKGGGRWGEKNTGRGGRRKKKKREREEVRAGRGSLFSPLLVFLSPGWAPELREKKT